MRVHYKRDLARLCARALRHGATIPTLNVVRWDISGGCLDPHMVQLEGRAPEAGGLDDWGKFKRYEPHQVAPPARSNEYGYMSPLWLDILTRCRKCDPCRKARRRFWAKRAQLEAADAHRTWFCTYTFRPSKRLVIRYQAEARFHKKVGGSWYGLTPDEQFPWLAVEAGKELTKYFKRLRKNTRAPLRYILIAENHKDGFPHFHALVHQMTGKIVTERRLRWDWWPCGFSKCELVANSEKAANYVTKYITKTVLTRIRASQFYGKSTVASEATRSLGRQDRQIR